MAKTNAEEVEERLTACKGKFPVDVDAEAKLLYVIAELLVEIKDKLTTGAVEVYGNVTVDGEVTTHEYRG